MIDFIYSTRRCGYTNLLLNNITLSDDLDNPCIPIHTNELNVSIPYVFERNKNFVDEIKEFLDFYHLDHSRVKEYILYDCILYTIKHDRLYFSRFSLDYDNDIVIRHTIKEIGNKPFKDGYVYFIGSDIIDSYDMSFIAPVYGYFSSFSSAYRELKRINKIKPYQAEYFILKVSINRENVNICFNEKDKLLCNEFLQFNNPKKFYDFFMKNYTGEMWLYDDKMKLIYNTLYESGFLFAKDRLYDKDFVNRLKISVMKSNDMDCACGRHTFEDLGMYLDEEYKRRLGWGIW